MTTRANEASPQVWARTAGVLYLVTIICGVFAEVVARGKVLVRDDAAATAMNILANEQLYRSGLAADLLMLLSYVGVTILLYLLFRPVSKVVSLLAATSSLIGIAVLAVNSLTHFAPLLLLKNNESLRQFDAADLQTLAFLSLRLHGRGYLIATVFFGSYCLMIGSLAFRARFLPSVIGVLMWVGGASYLLTSFMSILSPALAARLPDATILGGVAELSLTLWLIIMGVDAVKWQERQASSLSP